MKACALALLMGRYFDPFSLIKVKASWFPPLPGTFAPFRNETPEPVYHGGSFLRDTCAKALLGLSPVPADVLVKLEDLIRERRLSLMGM